MARPYRGFKPISKAYFATASSKASEQFIYFQSLISWLLSINNHQVSGWNKYDDPMTASQNVIIELQKLGLELDVSPGKLKAGHGEGVTLVLLKLTEVSLKNKFRFKRPVMKEDGQDLGDDPEDGDDMDGGADMADMIHGESIPSDFAQEVIAVFKAKKQ